MASIDDLHKKLAEMKAKTATMRAAAEEARSRAEKAKADYNSYTAAHQSHSVVIAALQRKIASVNADTKTIDNGLRAEDHAADRGGAAGMGPRGGRFVMVNGKKHYLKR